MEKEKKDKKDKKFIYNRYLRKHGGGKAQIGDIVSMTAQSFEDEEKDGLIDSEKVLRGLRKAGYIDGYDRLTRKGWDKLPCECVR